MPIVNRETENLLSVPTGVLPALKEPEAPTTGDIFGAAFQQNNLVGSFLADNTFGVDNKFDPNYSAWDEVKGTPYEDKWDVFATSNNKRYTDSLKLQVDQEDRNNRTLAAGGWTSTGANLAAGILDPTIFIPVGGEIAKGVEGYRLLKAGLQTARVGAIATAVQETGLQATQETRPLSESVENVGFGTILSGIVGTGAAAIFTKAEVKAAQKGFDTIVNETSQPASAGAAATSHSLGLENLTVAPESGASVIAKATQNLSPGLRLNYSPSPIARQLGQELGESSVYQTGHAEGVTTGAAVERQAIMKFRAKDAAGLRALNQLYKDMGKAGINMSFDDFAKAVGRAASNGDLGENDFISAAAKGIRSAVFDPLFKEGKEVGVWKEGDDVAFAESYFPSQYRKDEMIGRENEVKPQLYEEMHKVIQSKYAKAAAAFRTKIVDLEADDITKQTNKFRNTWEGKNLGSGVDPHDPQNLPNFNNLSKLIVDDWYEKVTGRDHGSSASIDPDYMTPIKRGPINERTFPIQRNILNNLGILELRADYVLRNFARMVSGDIELTRKYGNPRMDDQFKALADDYAKLREAAGNDPKKLKSLDSDFRHDQRDISAMRDLIRGIYRMEQNISSYARVVGVANRFNFIRKMGHVVVRSLSDIARPAMVHGLLPYMRDGLLPLIRSFEAVKLSNAESKLMAITVDHEIQFRVMALSNLSDPFERGTGIERFMEGLSTIASKLTLLPYWNDFWKGISSRISQNQILSGALDQRTRAFLGIDPAMWEAIQAQHALHGEIVGGIHIPNTEQWTNENAVRAFRAAVGKDVDSIIVTPGYADQPLLAHRPTGRLLLQFKSYEFASHSKVLLRGLQEGKTKFVAGMVTMSTLGMLSSALGAWTGGRIVWEKYKKAAQNPGYLVGEGLDQAGIFAIPFDVANTSERVSNTLHYHVNPIKTPAMAVGSWAYPESSMQGKNIHYRDENLADVLGGPSIGTLEDVGLAASGGVDKLKGKKLSRSQQKAGIRLLPLNNFYGISEGIQVMTGDSPYDPEQNLALTKQDK